MPVPTHPSLPSAAPHAIHSIAAGAKPVACVDIGGTKVAVSVADLAGLRGRVSEPTCKEGTNDALAHQIIRLIGQSCASAGVAVADVSSVGVSSCGPFVLRDGLVELAAPNICGGLAGPAAALVHQRVFVKAGWHLGATCLAHQFDVVEVGRAVGPLIGPRQGRHALAWLESKGVPCLAAVERGVQVFQLRRDEIPVVQHMLQRAGDAGGVVRGGAVARDDNQVPVT